MLAEAVGDDTQTAEHHQPTCEHRIELVACEGVEYSCCYRDGDEVIDARPEEVLVDGAEGRPC